MQQLDQVIQQNASASEEMSTGADELSSQAGALQGAISFFKVNGALEQSRHRAAPARRKALPQRAAFARTSAAAKPKSGNVGGFDIEIGSEIKGADPQDRDFTTYQ
jgi:methyl-accepting chemotaxis protein